MALFVVAGPAARPCTVQVPAPRRAAVLASRRDGRRAIVASAASDGPGCSHGTAFDREAVVTDFRSKLEAVKITNLALVDYHPSPPSEKMKPLLRCAGGCIRLLEIVVMTESMSRYQFEEVALAGENFLRVAGQCVQGYITAQALVRAEKALDVLTKTFWPSFIFPKVFRVQAVVPSDLLHMRAQDYLEDLMHAFVFKGLMVILVATSKLEEFEGPWVQFDSEAALLKLKVKLEIFQFTYRPMAIVCGPTSPLLATALEVASGSILPVENLLWATPHDEKHYQVLLHTGEGMMSIILQCQQGYLRASSLVEATDSLRLVGEWFLPNPVFPTHLLSFSIPLTSDGLLPIRPDIEFPSHKQADKELFFQNLLVAFVSKVLLGARRNLGDDP